MICPQTKQECESVACERDGCVAQLAEMPRLPIAGRELLSIRKSSPLPPTLAEIERLAGDVSLALSALMAAIQKYGRE